MVDIKKMKQLSLMIIDAANEIEQLRFESDTQKLKIEELQDFCIWLTGCGYDFCQHEYYLKKRAKLLK